MNFKLLIIWDLIITTLFSINISVPVNLTFLQPQTWMCSYWLSAGWAWGRGCAAERERRKRGEKKNPIQWSDKNHLHTTVERTDARVCKTHSYDDADSRHTRGGHDFGTVGDEVEQDGNDGFRSMVEFIPQHCREVATRIHTEKYSTNMLWSQNTIKVVGKAIIKVGRNLINVHYSLLDPHKVVAVLLGS